MFIRAAILAGGIVGLGIILRIICVRGFWSWDAVKRDCETDCVLEERGIKQICLFVTFEV